MKVVKNYIYNSSYQLLLILLPLVTAPYISRTLGAKGIGINTFTLAITGYFVIFSVLGTSSYGNREIAYHRDDKEVRSRIFWELNFFSWLTSLITLIAFFLFLSFYHQYTSIFLWQSLAIFTSMFDVSWYFSGTENFKMIATRNFIIKILSVAAIFLLVRRSEDLWIYVAIVAVSGLLGSLSLWPYLHREIQLPQFSKLKIFRHWKGLLVLFLPTVLVNVYVIVSKTLIAVMDSVVHAGFFNQADTILRMVEILVGSIGVVMLPHVANLFAKGEMKQIKQSISKTFNIGTGLAVALSFGLAGISLKFAPFFFGTEFKMVGIILLLESPIIIFLTWGNVFGIQYLLPMKRMKEFTISATIGALTSIILNLLLIPYFGVLGSTVVSVIAQLAVVVYEYYVIRKEFNFAMLVSGIWRYFLAGLLMFSIVFWMNFTFKMTVVQLILQIMVGIFAYLLMNVILKTQLWELAIGVLRKRRIRD